VSPEARNQLLFIAVVVLLLFVMVIRPARKRAQHVSKLQAALSPGDEVMLTSGIFATVLSIQDDTGRVQVSVAEGVVLTVHRGAIAEIVRDVPADEATTDSDSDSADAPDSAAASSADDTTRSADAPGAKDAPAATDTDTAKDSDDPDTDATTSHDATSRGAN
jgi:preprotein translocase subunit YajC